MMGHGQLSSLAGRLLLGASLLVWWGWRPAGAADLVAHYPLAGDALDRSGNGFDGVVTDVAFVVDPARGTVASFNGASSSIDVSASGFSITESPNLEFALAFWIKPTARDDYHPGGATDLNPIMGASRPGRGVIEIVGQGSWHGMGGVPAYGGVGLNSGGGAGSVARVEGIDLYDGAWHHVVVQWVDPDGSVAGGEGADATIYIDGELAADVNGQTYNGNGDATSRFHLGGPVVWSDGGPADKYFDGLLSEVKFFRAPLAPEEISGLLTGGGTDFRVTGLHLAPGDAGGRDLSLTWTSSPGEWFEIQKTSDLGGGAWGALAPFLAAAEDPASETTAVVELGVTGTRAFYRLARVGPPPLFSEGFEAGAPGWVSGLIGDVPATATAWEIGSPAGGPGAARGGAAAAGTDLDADYEDATAVFLRSPAIDWSARPGAQLRFWYFLQAGDTEGGRIILREIGVDGAEVAGIDPVLFAGATKGVDDWTEAAVALPDLGRPAHIEFQFLSEIDAPGDNGAGWFIDDVAVE